MYKYVGYNGTILSEVLLPGIMNLPYVKLKASAGHVLQKGNIKQSSVLVPESEVDLWVEVPKG
jgi:hypothetical protein